MLISDWSADVCSSDLGDEVEVMTEPFKGLALGVFLITVGMSLELRLVAANWLGLGGAVIGVVAIKTAVTVGLLRFTGSSEERRVGQEGVRTCRSWWSAEHYKNKHIE